MGYTDHELVDIGSQFALDRLIDWATGVHGVCNRNHARLAQRGVTAEFLADIERRIRELRDAHHEATRGKRVEVETVTPDQARHDQLLDWWFQVKQMVKIEFDGNPDAQSAFRTGVRVSRSIPKLLAEVERLLPLLEAHRAQLRWLGATDEFIAEGRELLGMLRSAYERTLAERATDHSGRNRLNILKAKLYLLVKKLVRIGRLEFRNEPETAEQFNYDLLRVGARASKRISPRETIVSPLSS